MQKSNFPPRDRNSISAKDFVPKGRAAVFGTIDQGVSVLLTGRPQCNYRRSHWACWAVSSKISGRRLRRGNFRSFFHNIKNSCYFRSISIHQLDLVQNFFSNLLLLFRSASAQKSVYLMFRPVVGIPLCVYERVRLKTWALSLLPKERCFQKRLDWPVDRLFLSPYQKGPLQF